jgi:hypothetical protein
MVRGKTAQAMNQSWPLALSKRGMQEIRPLTETVPRYADDLIRMYRPQWDSFGEQQSPNLRKPISAEGRLWYLRRDTGLRAFARYEAELRLKPFSKDGFITGDDFYEAELQRDIFRRGLAVLGDKKWKVFIPLRREMNTTFRQKLAVWLSRKTHKSWKSPGGLADYTADTRIEFYALLYDRYYVPLEFCSDEYSVDVLTGATQSEYWRGSRTDLTRAAVRRWRRNLGLKPSPHIIGKMSPHIAGKRTAVGVPQLDSAAARRVGLPYDIEANERVIPKAVTPP